MGRGGQNPVDVQWFIHGSLNVPIEHHPTIRYMVYNGYYKVMSNIPKMGHLPTPVIVVSSVLRHFVLRTWDEHGINTETRMIWTEETSVTDSKWHISGHAHSWRGFMKHPRQNRVDSGWWWLHVIAALITSYHSDLWHLGGFGQRVLCQGRQCAFGPWSERASRCSKRAKCDSAATWCNPGNPGNQEALAVHYHGGYHGLPQNRHFGFNDWTNGFQGHVGCAKPMPRLSGWVLVRRIWFPGCGARARLYQRSALPKCSLEKKLATVSC